MNKELNENKLKNVLAWIASTQDGKTFLAWLFELTEQLGPIGDYSDNPLHMSFTNGKRSVGAEVFSLLGSIDPKYLQIITSQMIEERIDYGRVEPDE